MGLTKLAITRPVFILMLMLAAFLMGTIAYRGMRVEQNPEVTFGAITVNTAYPGAGPEEVNTLVSRKIEEAVSGVNGLREVTSTSLEGVSLVFANFDIQTDMDVALNDLRSKVDAVLGNLPEGVLKPTITKFDSTSDPVMNIAFQSDKLDNEQLRDLVDDKIKDKFARLTGVASATVSGGELREIQVQVRKDKLIAYGIGITDVLRAVQSASLNVPSGRSVTRETEVGIRVLGEYRTVEEIGNTTLSIRGPNQMGGNGQLVKLSDVADVVDTTSERRSYSRLNGTDTVTMTIQKARTGNAVQISKLAKELIPLVEQQYAVKTIVTFDQAVYISESLADLNLALFFGILLVSLIVFLFLHNMRGTIIVCIAIPVCLMATFIVIAGMGFTINSMTMLALSLAVGVLVDDAIVVLENIYRHLEMGEEPIVAAINGRSEIGVAAIAITLADVVVWGPIAFMGGVVGQFFRPLGIAFGVCVLLSLFVSFTVTPMLASRWYRKGEDMEHPTGRFAQWFERSFKNLGARYGRLLEWALNHRWFVFLGGFAALVGVFMMIGGGFAPDYATAAKGTFSNMLPMILVLSLLVTVINFFRGYKSLKYLFAGAGLLAFFVFMSLVGHAYGAWKKDAIFKFQFFPESDSGRITVGVELPPGSNLAATEEVVRTIEERVSSHPDTKYVVSRIGSRTGGFGAGSVGTNYGQVDVTLNDKRAMLDSIMFWVQHKEKLRSKNDTSIAADLLERIGKVPGSVITVAASGAQGFGSPIQMSFASDDRESLQVAVEEIRRRLANGEIEGVINVDTSSKPGKPEVRAIPDRTRMADASMTTADLAAVMRVLYEGNDDTKFRVRGREYPIRVMLDIKDRNNPAIIDQMPLKFSDGNPIFLNQVASLQDGVTVDKVERRNREEEIRINADLLPGFAAGTVQTQINEWLAKEELIPQGIKKVELGQADVQNREQGYLFGAFMLGIVLVYMVLASLYDNLLYPLIIQLAQPQAMVGALLALIVTDKMLNIVGFVGIIALVGLVGKNAILLVDYTNTLRERGRNRHDALVEAGPTRLRPITMTTLAVILGMLPVALAIGRGSEFRETIGITIIGGILLSTVLTLVVIPCSYTIFDDMSLALGRVLRRFQKHSPDEAGTTSSHSAEAEAEPASRQ